MYKFMDRLARGFALLGGVVLSLLIALTCISVTGRSLNSIFHSMTQHSVMSGFAESVLATGVGPVNGDFELVEAGMAFVIFAFLPLCQLNGSHASVDIFTQSLSIRANRVLRMVIEVVFAAVLFLIAWQLFLGTVSKFESGQTTLLLQFPVWWSYVASLCGAVVTVIISIYVAALRCLEVATGQQVLPAEMEADH